jgi:hypothetical protein
MNTQSLQRWQMNRFYTFLSRFFAVTDAGVGDGIGHMGWLFPMITSAPYLKYALNDEKVGFEDLEKVQKRMGMAEKEEPNLTDHSVENLRKLFRVAALLTMGPDCTEEQADMAEAQLVGVVISMLVNLGKSLTPEALAEIREAGKAL